MWNKLLTALVVLQPSTAGSFAWDPHGDTRDRGTWPLRRRWLVDRWVYPKHRSPHRRWGHLSGTRCLAWISCWGCRSWWREPGWRQHNTAKEQTLTGDHGKGVCVCACTHGTRKHQQQGLFQTQEGTYLSRVVGNGVISLRLSIHHQMPFIIRGFKM